MQKNQDKNNSTRHHRRCACDGVYTDIKVLRLSDEHMWRYWAITVSEVTDWCALCSTVIHLSDEVPQIFHVVTSSCYFCLSSEHTAPIVCLPVLGEGSLLCCCSRFLSNFPQLKFVEMFVFVLIWTVGLGIDGCVWCISVHTNQRELMWCLCYETGRLVG